MKKILLVIAGPTASGKTALAIRLAKHFHTEVVSADSRQFFREMNIGTAKPSAQQLREVPHHFINSQEVAADYNAGLFSKECNNLLGNLFKKLPVIILTGGSGLYIDAVINGMDDLPDADKQARELLKKELEEKGILFLQQKLQRLDPESFSRIDLFNPQRIIRALEVCMVTGRSYSSHLNKKKRIPDYQVIYVCLDVPRELLYERINLRVDQMIIDGLEDEVKKLMPFKNQPAMKTVGYSEFVLFFEGKIARTEAIEKIKQHTRNYAKRQLTWFSKLKSIQWMKPDDEAGIISLIENHQTR